MAKLVDLFFSLTPNPIWSMHSCWSARDVRKSEDCVHFKKKKTNNNIRNFSVHRTSCYSVFHLRTEFRSIKKKRGLCSLFYISFFSWIIFSVKRFFSLVYYVCEKSENEVRCGVTGQPRSSREKKWNIKRNKAGRPFRPFPNVQIMNGKKSEREREREKKREKGVQ